MCCLSEGRICLLTCVTCEGNEADRVKTEEELRKIAEWSAAWPSGSERRFYDGHDLKVHDSTPTQASLLHPWIRCFTTIISAWWNLTSSKLKKQQAKFIRKTRKQRQLLSESGFFLRIAPPSLSRDRRIKMKKSNQNQYVIRLT